MTRGRWVLGLAGLLAAASGLAQGPSPAAPTVDPAALRFFETKVRPLLAENCFKCHGPEKQRAGLRLDVRATILKGGESGPAVVPGQPEKSLLIDAVNHGEAVQMPPTGKLPPQAIVDLTEWVRMGAPWPREQISERPSAHNPGEFKLTPEDKAFWAFQSPRKPPIPSVVHTSWPRSPIDYFVLAQLDTKGVQPTPSADQRTLIRRLSFDLTGLPPTPEAIEDFLNQSAIRNPQSAIESLVERLLASPQYGERWGRHWLDVARYADSNGADENRVHANAWRYRDYVVAAFNEDKPYDQFILEQLAGDLLPAADREERKRNWIATGFLAVGPKPLLANDAVKVELDVVDEQIDTVGRAFMGLTLGCARCHDHKFDPLPTSDYYSLAGIFKSTTTIDRYDFQNHRSWTERALGSTENEQEHQRLKVAYDQANENRRLSDDQDEQKKHSAQMKAVRKELAAIPVAMAVREGNVANTQVLLRGNHLTPGAEVPRRFPRILAGEDQALLSDEASGRLELARWLVRPDHPLTARVMVNRIWKWHFGEGLVRSVDNFGRLSERPDNQALLDYLAVHFVESGWSIKAMHRLILLSSTYCQSSHPQFADHENRLLSRMNPRRLDAEEIRDAMLLVSGQLDLRTGGTLLRPEFNFSPVSELGRSKGGGPIGDAYATRRRSLYLPVIRGGLYEMFQLFDFADPSVVTGRRDTTTVAPQALLLMNSDLVWEASQHFAQRLLSQPCCDESRVGEAYERAYSRLPNPQETARALKFIQRYEDELQANGVESQDPRLDAWQAWCRVILTSNEFVYLQ